MGEDVSTYAYITSKGGGNVLQSGVIEVSGVIPSYTPIPSDNQADIHVELTPLTSCGQVGQTIESNTVTPANNPRPEVEVEVKTEVKSTTKAKTKAKTEDEPAKVAPQAKKSGGFLNLSFTRKGD